MEPKKMRYLVTIKPEYIIGIIKSTSIADFGYFIGTLEQTGETLRFKIGAPVDYEDTYVIIPEKYIALMMPLKEEYGARKEDN